VSIRLFVGNLSYEVTEADLRAVFAEVGPVSVVRMPVDRETGRVRGFAFVDYNERSDGEAAIARLNQQMLKGRALAVSEAVAREDAPRAPRPASGYGGGGGGGGGGYGGGSPMGAPAARPAGPGAATTKSFGPDALPRNKRKPAGGKAGGAGGERGPRGPIKERNSGRSHAGGELEDDDTNDVPFWAQDDGKDDE